MTTDTAAPALDSLSLVESGRSAPWRPAATLRTARELLAAAFTEADPGGLRLQVGAGSA